MPFPITLNIAQGAATTDISFYNGCLTLIGPNGSGKTQLLKQLKNKIGSLANMKKVRYLSAGRIGSIEQYRADMSGNPNQYRGSLSFGSKGLEQYRHNSESINGDFQTLSARPDILIKVQERLNKLFNRSIFIEWDAGDLKASFQRIDIDSAAYSSASEASGLIQLVAILAALYDDDVGALLLDEPEVSLHPQLQSFLMKEIERCAGDIQENKKLIVLATHSTEFIRVSKATDLCNIVFCTDPTKPPIQLKPDMDNLKNKKLNALLARIGHEHKLAFFSTRPLLVEGVSDSIICRGIERKLEMFIEAAGAQIVPLNSKGDFPAVYKFFKLIGKEPIILADGDAFTDSMNVPLLYINSDIANKKANESCAENINKLVRNVYADFCTLANSQVNSYRNALESTVYWKNKSGDDDTKIYRRAFLSLMYTITDTDVMWQNEDIKTMKIRLDSLFSILNSAGCFILKKGTVESYYAYSDKETSYRKPLAAVEEVDFFTDKDRDFMISQYNDIYSCLKYAAKTKDINEVEALKDFLLEVLAPVLGTLDKGATQAEVQSKIRNAASGKGEKIFDIKLDTTDNKKVHVNVKSKILDAECFPFEISSTDNLIQTVNRKLGLQARNDI